MPLPCITVTGRCRWGPHPWYSPGCTQAGLCCWRRLVGPQKPWPHEQRLVAAVGRQQQPRTLPEPVAFGRSAVPARASAASFSAVPVQGRAALSVPRKATGGGSSQRRAWAAVWWLRAALRIGPPARLPPSGSTTEGQHRYLWQPVGQPTRRRRRSLALSRPPPSPCCPRSREPVALQRYAPVGPCPPILCGGLVASCRHSHRVGEVVPCEGYCEGYHLGRAGDPAWGRGFAAGRLSLVKGS